MDMLRMVYFILLLAALLLSVSAAMASDPQSSATVPRRLTLPQAEDILIERNLTVLAARYQVDANRAARLIAGYKLNPVLTVGAEQVPFYSPLAGSYPRFVKTNPDAGANPVYTLRIDTVLERGGKRELRTAAAEEQLKASEAQLLDAVRTQQIQLRRAFTAATLAREKSQTGRNNGAAVCEHGTPDASQSRSRRHCQSRSVPGGRGPAAISTGGAAGADGL